MNFLFKSLFLLTITISSHFVSAQKINFIPFEKGLPFSTLYKMAIDKDGGIWIGTDNGVLEFSDNKWTLNELTDSLRNNITHIFIDSQDRKWCIAYKYEKNEYFARLYLIEDKEISSFGGTAGVIVKDIIEDNEGNIWAATGKKEVKIVSKNSNFFKKGSYYPGGAVFKYNNDQFDYVDITPGYNKNIFINNIDKIDNDLFFLGYDTKNERLVKYNNNEFTTISKQKGYDGLKYSYELTKDNDGNIWAFTYDQMKTKLVKVGNNYSFSSYFPRVNTWHSFGVRMHAKFYHFNNELYHAFFGTFMHYNKAKDEWIFTKEKGLNLKGEKWISDVVEMPNKSLLIGTGNGLRIYDDEMITNSPLLKHKSISMLYITNNGTIIIGTFGDGLYTLKNDKLQKIETDMNENTIPHSIYSKKIVRENVLYVLTKSGVLQISGI